LRTAGYQAGAGSFVRFFMRKPIRIFLLLLAVMLLGLLLPGRGSQSLAAGKVKLEVHEDTVYTITAPDNQIAAHTTLIIINRDASTRKKSRGSYYYYDRIFWELPKGATNITAKRGNGTRLKVRLKKKGREYDTYIIRFRRELVYKQKMKIELRYTLKEGHPPFYISENVVSLPGYEIEYKDWVYDGRMEVDFPEGFTVELDSDLCSVDANRAICEKGVSSQWAGYFFAIEASREAKEKELLSDPVAMQEQDIRIRVRYVEGEDVWAHKVVAVLTEALPVLEKVMGFPYQGSGEIEVVRSTASETMGYEGLYEDADTVRIHPSASRGTIVHEGAHLWSWPFESVWLSEGWAEWSARETMRRLKMNPESEEFKMPRRDKIKMPLQDWEHMGLQNPEDEDVEMYGYAKSYDTIRRLVKLAGLKKVQEVNAAFAERCEDDASMQADSYAYLELLLQRTPNRRKAGRLRKLWKARVLNKQGKALLAQRDAMWKKVRALEARIEPLGWVTPQSLLEDMLYWRYYSARSDLRNADKVLDAWEAALPLFEQLGWQPDDLVQRRFEEESDWDRTIRAAEHRLKLAQQGAAVQEKLASDASLSADAVTQARSLLQEAGQALQGGNSYRADKLLAQAQALVGLTDADY
jgi:hypothetical protein